MSLPEFNILINFSNFTNILGKPQVSYLAKYYSRQHLRVANRVHRTTPSHLSQVGQACPHTDRQLQFSTELMHTQWVGAFMHPPPTFTTVRRAPQCTLHPSLQPVSGRSHTLSPKPPTELADASTRTHVYLCTMGECLHVTLDPRLHPSPRTHAELHVELPESRCIDLHLAAASYHLLRTSSLMTKLLTSLECSSSNDVRVDCLMPKRSNSCHIHMGGWASRAVGRLVHHVQPTPTPHANSPPLLGWPAHHTGSLTNLCPNCNSCEVGPWVMSNLSPWYKHTSTKTSMRIFPSVRSHALASAHRTSHDGGDSDCRSLHRGSRE